MSIIRDGISSGWIDPSSYPGIEIFSKQWKTIHAEIKKIVSLNVPWLYFTDNDSVVEISHLSQEQVEEIIRPRLVPLTAPFHHKLLPLFRARHAFSSAHALCPKTIEMIQSFPYAINAAFAALEAGGKIDPHQGSSNQIDRCHLGLIIPRGDAAMRVSNITKQWNEGGLMIFDDHATHETWNKTTERRVVLIVDLEKKCSVNRRCVA